MPAAPSVHGEPWLSPAPQRTMIEKQPLQPPPSLSLTLYTHSFRPLQQLLSCCRRKNAIVNDLIDGEFTRLTAMAIQ